MKLKPIAEQVIVLTGATSGIGLVTARLAFDRGARLVLNSRNNEALSMLAHELDPMGERVVWVAGDVAEHVRRHGPSKPRAQPSPDRSDESGPLHMLGLRHRSIGNRVENPVRPRRWLAG